MADVGEVTFRVVEAEAPGETEREAAVKAPVQPEGTVEVRVKTDAVQGLTSLLVTEMVKLTAVPAATPAVCEGRSETTGATCVQVGGGVGVGVGEGVGVGDGGGAPERVTATVAPVALTELTTIETPDVASVNVCPTTRAGSVHEEVPAVMSRRSLLLGSEGDARWTTTPLETFELLPRPLSNPSPRRSST